MNVNNNNGAPILHEYVEKNDLNGLQELLQLSGTINLNIDIYDDKKGTPLHTAIRSRKYEMVKLLLAYGADVNKLHEKKIAYTPLHMAINNSDKDIVELLLEYNPDLCVKNQFSNTPLLNAILTWQLDIAKLFLQRGGIDINIGDAAERRPIHWAFLDARLPIIEDLLNAPNLDVNVRDFYGKTALHNFMGYSINKEFTKERIEKLLVIIKPFSSRFDINIKDENGDTPLHSIAKGTFIDLSRYVIEQLEVIFSEDLPFGIDPTIKNNDGLTYKDILAQHVE